MKEWMEEGEKKKKKNQSNKRRHQKQGRTRGFQSGRKGKDESEEQKHTKMN